jgi:hypothetical protein
MKVLSALLIFVSSVIGRDHCYRAQVTRHYPVSVYCVCSVGTANIFM